MTLISRSDISAGAQSALSIDVDSVYVSGVVDAIIEQESARVLAYVNREYEAVEDVPADVKGVCVDLCLFRIDQKLNGNQSKRSITKNMGGIAENTSKDYEFETRTLERVHHHRKLL